VDHLAIGNWMFSAVNRDEDSPMPEAPEPVPRPGVEDADGHPADVAASGPDQAPTSVELARFFG
jgi:hypothetical protein